jgi:hypothetical protein
MRALVPGTPWLSSNTQASADLTTTLRAAQLGTAFVGRMCRYSFSPVTPNTRPHWWTRRKNDPSLTLFWAS